MEMKTKIFIIMALAIIVFGWSNNSKAGFYIDAGIGYIKGIEATETISLEVGDFILNVEAKGEAPISSSIFILRTGYEYCGLHLEIETIGVPDQHIEIFSTYYRWKF